MVKIVDKMQRMDDQINFINKLQIYRQSQLTQKAHQRKLLGQSLTQDGITYLFAILSKTI